MSNGEWSRWHAQSTAFCAFCVLPYAAFLHSTSLLRRHPPLGLLLAGIGERRHHSRAHARSYPRQRDSLITRSRTALIPAMAGLSPGNYISACKRLTNRSRQGNPYLKAIMVQAACSAINGGWLRLPSQVQAAQAASGLQTRRRRHRARHARGHLPHYQERRVVQGDRRKIPQRSIARTHATFKLERRGCRRFQ